MFRLKGLSKGIQATVKMKNAECQCDLIKPNQTEVDEDEDIMTDEEMDEDNESCGVDPDY